MKHISKQYAKAVKFSYDTCPGNEVGSEVGM